MACLRCSEHRRPQLSTCSPTQVIALQGRWAGSENVLTRQPERVSRITWRVIGHGGAVAHDV